MAAKDPPLPKLPKFAKYPPQDEDLFLIACVVLKTHPKMNLVTWATHVSAAASKYWVRKLGGVQTWVMPYYSKIVKAVWKALQVKGDPELFQIYLGKAHAVLPERVFARASTPHWKQQPGNLAFKYFHNRMYKLWLQGRSEYPDNKVIAEVIGWTCHDPFVPQLIISWEDFQSGQWNSRLENLDWAKLNSELPYPC